MSQRLNWSYLASLTAVVVVPVLVWVTGMDPKLAAALAGTAATALLAYRLVETYPVTEAASRASIAVVIVLLVLSAVGQFQLASSHPEVTTVVAYPNIGARVACVLLGIYWPYLLGSGKRSPLLRPPA